MTSGLMETEALSDEQIEQLIQEAETRARAKAGVLTAPEPEDKLTLPEETPGLAQRKAIPKLKHGLERQSYIREQHGVAQVKPDLLATREQQTLADRLRTVQVQKSKEKVCYQYSSWFHGLSHEENHANSLDADPQLIMSCPCLHESNIIFIVTLTASEHP